MSKYSEKKSEQSQKVNIKYDVASYLLGIILVVLAPVAGGIIAPFLDFAGYGAMRPFFKELFTSIIWVVIVIIAQIIYLKKLSYNLFCEKGYKSGELPIKRILFIGGIVALCIIIISAQIGFQVKPFYDLGEKFNGYDLFNNLGIFLRNAVKCVLVVIMLKAATNIIESFNIKNENYIPYAGIVLALTVGIYDLIMGLNNLSITYFFLYVVYGWIYLLTEKAPVKSYLIILFLFLF